MRPVKFNFSLSHITYTYHIHTYSSKLIYFYLYKVIINKLLYIVNNNKKLKTQYNLGIQK